MAGRPRREAPRGYVVQPLRDGFGADGTAIAHERFLLDRSGRIDALWGAVVVELESDLRRELPDVPARMPDHLADVAARSRSAGPVTGLATDGAASVAHTLQDGVLRELGRHVVDPERPDELVAWLEPLLSDSPDLAPDARAVARASGRGSLTFARARLTLDMLWAGLRGDADGIAAEIEALADALLPI